MNSESQLLSLTAQGHEMMARERSLLMQGQFANVALLSADKAGLLETLEVTMAQMHGTEPVRNALAALIADSRRNERIIIAARQGVASARRRIEAIIATRRGAVAYGRDGSAITSRDDAAEKSSRA
jgi:hypothetical protein